MPNKKTSPRKNYFINKKFQIAFSIRFLVLIVLAAIAALGLFLYNSQGTLTTGYSGSELKLLKTSVFFLPMLLMSTIGVIIVTGIIGILVLIYLSHRIAGPIFRFQKVLVEIDKGDLTHRFKLRENDQFKELADRINDLARTMDAKVGRIKVQAVELSRLMQELNALSASHPSLKKELERPLHEISQRLSELQDAANHFKTSDAK
jgi:methyl-accepting chemotaxis protein